MKLSALREAADRYGDLVSAYVDVSRTDAQGAQEVELRCRNAAEEALAEGADPAETVDALRRGEVETLVLLDGAVDGREAAVGPEPLNVGHTADEVRALGVDEPGTASLEDALLRAALGQDAGLLPLHAPVGALPDGVGAVLHFDSRPA